MSASSNERASKRITLSKTARGFVLSAPKRTPNYIINAFIKSNGLWLQRHSSKIGRDWGIFKISYKSASSNLVVQSGNAILFHHESDLESKQFKEYREIKLQEISKTRLLKIAPKYLDMYQALVKKPINKVRYKKIYSRWGSCSSRGNINLSIYLGKLPEELIEYVIAHEVTHLIHQNHSKAFWSELYSLNQNFKNLKKELKKYHSGV